MRLQLLTSIVFADRFEGRHIKNPSFKRFVWMGPFAFVWFFGCIVLLAALHPDYSHSTKSISELGAIGAPNMLWMNAAGFVATGIFLGVFALAYKDTLEGAPGWQALLLTSVAFSLTAIPIELTEQVDPDMSALLTRVHFVLVMLVPLPWCWALVSIVQRGVKPAIPGLPAFSGFLLALFTLLFFLGITRAFPHIPGLLQRASFLIFLGWYAITGILLMTRAGWTRGTKSIPQGTPE